MTDYLLRSTQISRGGVSAAAHCFFNFLSDGCLAAFGVAGIGPVDSRRSVGGLRTGASTAEMLTSSARLLSRVQRVFTSYMQYLVPDLAAGSLDSRKSILFPRPLSVLIGPYPPEGSRMGAKRLYTGSKYCRRKACCGGACKHVTAVTAWGRLRQGDPRQACCRRRIYANEREAQY